MPRLFHGAAMVADVAVSYNHQRLASERRVSFGGRGSGIKECQQEGDSDEDLAIHVYSYSLKYYIIQLSQVEKELRS